MSRLTDLDYLKLRRFLAAQWMVDSRPFGLISMQDQRYLHDYFQLAADLTDLEALAHRRQITRDRPSLPQCAGRALRHFANPGVDLGPTLQGHNRRFVIHPVIRPDPDLARMRRALLAFVLDEQRKQSEDQDQAA